MSWVRRAVTQDGRGLYAPEGVCNCPELVMATLAELAEHGIQGQDLVADAVAVMGALPVPVGSDQPAVDKTHALITAALGDAKPARDGLLVSLAQTVKDRAEHAHPRVGEDLYCWNLTSYMGERMAPVLRRLVDAEAERAAEVANLRVMYDVVSQREHDLIEERDALLTRVADWEGTRRSLALVLKHGDMSDTVRQEIAQLISDEPDVDGTGRTYESYYPAAERTVDEDPIAYSLTVEALHASSGAVIETPSRREQSTAKLRDLLARQQAAVEDLHETPPRPRPTPHDLPEVTP